MISGLTSNYGAVARLEAALQRVLAPVAYVHTADTESADARAAAAENARAQAGLMLFMIEGLIRASVRQREKGICDVASVVHNAWLRWLQLGGRRAGVEVRMDGWLVEAYPSAWLQPASTFADALAMTSSIGRPPPLRGHGEMPSAFFEPLALCGFASAEHQLRRDLAAILGVVVGSITHVPGNTTPLPTALTQVAEPLFRDFYCSTKGLPVGGWARYPGH